MRASILLAVIMAGIVGSVAALFVKSAMGSLIRALGGP